MVSTTGRTIRKVMGGGGGGVGQQEFFSLSNYLYEYFLGRSINIFLGLVGVHELFFHLIFPCANIFFLYFAPPPISFLMAHL